MEREKHSAEWYRERAIEKKQRRRENRQAAARKHERALRDLENEDYLKSLDAEIERIRRMYN